jgi:hypothetical protein
MMVMIMIICDGDDNFADDKGALMETTDVAPPPAEWNNHIIKGFHKLEPPTPIIISFSVYKKKWYAYIYIHVSICNVCHAYTSSS